MIGIQMEQPNKIYVICENDFPYNDDWNVSLGFGKIIEIFYDHETAITTWKKCIQ